MHKTCLNTSTWQPDRRERERLLRQGDLHQLRRGGYVAYRHEDPLLRHRQMIDVVAPGLDAKTVLSHISAAVLYGLPVAYKQLGHVQATRSQRSGGRISEDVHIFTSRFTDADVAHVSGYRCTALTRTLLDLGRHVPLGWSVAACDHALAQGLIQLAEVDGHLRATPRRRGNVKARRMLALADARAESPGESLSRVVLHQAGLPSAELQGEISTAVGQFRVDFLWREYGVIGEFDGMIKYSNDLKPGQTSSDIVVAEKRREDALRASGYSVVRWVWQDIFMVGRLADLVGRALARA